MYRVAQSWVEVWIGPSVATPRSWQNMDQPWAGQMSPVHGAARGHAAASRAELVRTPSLPTKRQSHLPKHLGRLGRLGRDGTRSSQRAAASPPWGPLASVRRRRVGADCVQYSIFVSRNRFIASPAASDPYAGREPVALCRNCEADAQHDIAADGGAPPCLARRSAVWSREFHT